MKKNIFIMMFMVGALAMAGQSGLAQYRYTQGNYSLTVTNRAEFDAFGTEYDKELAFMEHRGGVDVATGQPGFDEYSYIGRDYSEALIDDGDEFAVRMSRGNMGFDKNLVTGQAGYAEYKYTQGGNYSEVMLKD